VLFVLSAAAHIASDNDMKSPGLTQINKLLICPPHPIERLGVEGVRG
jgi:hypothetical protein